MIPLLLSLTASAADPILSTLSFDVEEPEGDFTHHLQHGNLLEVPLGVSLAESVLTVGVDEQRADRVTVQYRYESAITVSLEGPHWDLIDFAHGDSGWRSIPAAADGRFTIPAMPIDALAFPEVSAEQITQAMRDYLGGVTAELPVCAGPDSDPCSVGLSRVWLNVAVWRGGRVVESDLFEIRIPMGC